MNYFTTWQETMIISMQSLWIQTVSLLPKLLGALIILVIGLIIASALGKLAKKLVKITHIDQLLEKTGISERITSAGLKFSFSALIGWVVKWFFIIVVLITVADILNLSQVTEFLTDVAAYIPNVIIAIIILAVGLVVGQFIHEIVEKSIKASRLPTSSAKCLAAISKWAIIIFALMAALIQLGIAARLVETLFTGLVVMLALAGGLAFGLGGKEKAAKLLEKLERETSEQNRNQ